MRKIKKTCTIMARCGLTSEWRCKVNEAMLPECEGCELVRRRAKLRKTINGVIYRKCSICGEYQPLKMFYKKTLRKPNGVVYHTEEGACKICRNEIARRQYREKKEKELKEVYGHGEKKRMRAKA